VVTKRKRKASTRGEKTHRRTILIIMCAALIFDDKGFEVFHLYFFHFLIGIHGRSFAVLPYILNAFPGKKLGKAGKEKRELCTL
jgi:nitrate/nitrite transporter NarK